MQLSYNWNGRVLISLTYLKWIDLSTPGHPDSSIHFRYKATHFITSVTWENSTWKAKAHIYWLVYHSYIVGPYLTAGSAFGGACTESRLVGKGMMIWQSWGYYQIMIWTLQDCYNFNTLAPKQVPTLSDITLSLLPSLTITLSFLSFYSHSYITLLPYFISDLSASDSLSRDTPYR